MRIHLHPLFGALSLASLHPVCLCPRLHTRGNKLKRSYIAMLLVQYPSARGRRGVSETQKPVDRFRTPRTSSCSPARLLPSCYSQLRTARPRWRIAIREATKNSRIPPCSHYGRDERVIRSLIRGVTPLPLPTAIFAGGIGSYGWIRELSHGTL